MSKKISFLELGISIREAYKSNSFQSFKVLLGYVHSGKESELFRHPYIGFSSLEILEIIVDDWKANKPEIFEMFIQGIGNFPPPLIGATEKGDVDIIKYLVSIGVDGRQSG